MNLYVGNLSYRLSEDELKEAFAAHGDVVSVKIVTDRETGRSKGFGFVEMGTEEAGEAAIEDLNGADFQGRNLIVNAARPKKEFSSRPPRR